MNLKHAFFKSARFTPTLICGNEIHETVEEIQGTPFGNYFCRGNAVFRLVQQSRSLKNFDKDFIKSSGLEERLKQEVEKIYKRRKQTKQELEKEMETLRSRKVLSFIENYVFRLMRKGDSPINHANNHSNGKDEIVEKLKECLRNDRFNILGKLFEKGIHLILGPAIYVLEETDASGEMYVRFSTIDYNLRPLCDLEKLEVIYNQLFEEAVAKEAAIADRNLIGIEETIQNIKELKKEKYNEGNFGFRRIKGSYYVTITVPPHCYVDGDIYYLFEPVEIGSRIPVSGKGEVGNITLATSKPVDFGTRYKHPALNPNRAGRIRNVCYKGGAVSDKDISMEIDAEVARKTAKIKDPLEARAYKVKLILERLGSFLMAEGYDRDAIPHVRLTPDQFKPHTLTEYRAWAKIKKAEGKNFFKTEI